MLPTPPSLHSQKGGVVTKSRFSAQPNCSSPREVVLPSHPCPPTLARQGSGTGGNAVNGFSFPPPPMYVPPPRVHEPQSGCLGGKKKPMFSSLPCSSSTFSSSWGGGDCPGTLLLPPPPASSAAPVTSTLASRGPQAER